MTIQPLKRDVLQAIADPTTAQLIQMLSTKEQSIVSLCTHFPVTRTAINKHLAVLLDAGLVCSEHVGRETRYSAHLEQLIAVKDWLSCYEKFWDRKLTTLKHFVENEDRGK